MRLAAYKIYLCHELIDEGIHEIWLPLLPMDDSHGVKGHSVVVLESQQLCDLPQVSPCLLREGLVRFQELGHGVRVVLLRDTVYIRGEYCNDDIIRSGACMGVDSLLLLTDLAQFRRDVHGQIKTSDNWFLYNIIIKF